MSQGQEGNMDITVRKRSTHLNTHRNTDTHTAGDGTDGQGNTPTHRQEGDQSVFMFVPPPLSQTCGPEAEKTAGHPLRWSER